MSLYHQGQIVRVTIHDSLGGNVKTRPAVIVTPTAEISPAGAVAVAAITTDLGRAGFSETVLLPWHPNGDPQTRLNKPSEAVCSWIVIVPVADLRDTGGSVPEEQLVEILVKVAKCN
jgi:mRNA-degrading endonuclease toxin of MazEF toxin-antitoxin module